MDLSARMTLAILPVAVLLGSCASGRVASGSDMPTEAAVGRRQDAFGPERTGIDQVQNPPVGTSIALGRGEVTRPRERNEPVPVATYTGFPEHDGGVGARDAGTDGATAPR